MKTNSCRSQHGDELTHGLRPPPLCHRRHASPILHFWKNLDPTVFQQTPMNDDLVGEGRMCKRAELEMSILADHARCAKTLDAQVRDVLPCHLKLTYRCDKKRHHLRECLRKLSRFEPVLHAFII